jgi:hypothetical protein
VSATLLLGIGAAIFGMLGLVHLAYTFSGTSFDPRDPACGVEMRATSPRLTRRTTMWKAWVGFNASHSLGAIVFAVVYLALAIRHPAVLEGSPLFAVIALANGLAYLALARAYWFRTPFIGILGATICFGVAAALTFVPISAAN